MLRWKVEKVDAKTHNLYKPCFVLSLLMGLDEAEVIKKALLEYKGNLEDINSKIESMFSREYLNKRIDLLHKYILALDNGVNELEAMMTEDAHALRFQAEYGDPNYNLAFTDKYPKTPAEREYTEQPEKDFYPLSCKKHDYEYEEEEDDD